MCSFSDGRPQVAPASVWDQMRSFAGGASVVWYLLLSATAVTADDAGTAVIALTLPESNTTSGYFPLSNALRSILRLAVADVNGGTSANAAATSVEGNLTLSVVEVATGSRAIKGLCEALAAVGENGTFGVSKISSGVCCCILAQGCISAALTAVQGWPERCETTACSTYIRS